MSRHTPAALVLTILIVLPSLAAAQSVVASIPGLPPLRTGVAQQISANPVGLMVDLFNVDYERRVTDAVSFGVGGSTATTEVYDYDAFYNETSHRERYLNGDVYVRFYPRGTALEGLAFGVKIGLTQVPDQGSYFGYGFDVNKSSILGKHFYFGYGGGLKRLVGVDTSGVDLAYVPTFRLNVGYAF